MPWSGELTLGSCFETLSGAAPLRELVAALAVSLLGLLIRVSRPSAAPLARHPLSWAWCDGFQSAVHLGT